jgi:hypothetical protein
VLEPIVQCISFALSRQVTALDDLRAATVATIP